ncbi:sensor histidine kinase [Nonomuraea cavernae]|uniref:sensor histidine kinase n=1 Tax=Nonomuraea cavernae TaxID=2045107 RepID=UPI0033C385FB
MTDRPARNRHTGRPPTAGPGATLLLALAMFTLSALSTLAPPILAPSAVAPPAFGPHDPGPQDLAPSAPGPLFHRLFSGSATDTVRATPGRVVNHLPQAGRPAPPGAMPVRAGVPAGEPQTALPPAAPLLAAATGVALVAATGVAGASRSFRRRRFTREPIVSGLRRAAARRRAIPSAALIEAALAEVVDRHRVEIRALDHALVRGAAVAEVAHLLTELVENALAFSPAESPVEMSGRAGTGGYHITIADEGIGMSDDELATANARVRGEQSLLVAPTRCLGHHLVGRLAERLGILVWLHESPRKGITVRVVLPGKLLDTELLDRELLDRELLDGRTKPGQGRRGTS